jgi:hypothetical protein
MRRVLAAVAVILAAPLIPGGRGHLLPPGGGLVQAQGAADCCVPLPVVATSKDPAKGMVRYELRLVDLEAIFSNRHVMFAGGWNDAFTALTYEIDRTGRYRMREKSAPPIVRQVALEEGGFTRDLIRPPGIPRVSDSVPARGNPATNRWARLGINDARTIVLALINTLARINKYGEPQAGLRDASLAAARFMVDALSTISDDLQLQDPAAQQIANASLGARGAMFAALTNVTPVMIAGRAANAPQQVNRQDELPLTEFDRANAVFDIYRSVDDNGNRTGLFTLRPYIFEESSSLLNTLLTLASARSQFGGAAVPGTPQDSMGCRAFSLIVDLADARTKGAVGLRDYLVDQYSMESKIRGASRLEVVRTAIILAGIESADEAKRLAETIIKYGLQTGGALPPAQVCAEISALLRGLEQSAGGPGRDTHRADFTQAVNARFEQIRKQWDSGQGSPEQKTLLDAWDAGGTAGKPAGLNGACAPAPGDIKGRIFLYAIVIDGLQVIDELYVGVPTIVEVQFDDQRGEKEMPIELSIGGQTVKLTAKRYDEAGRIFRTEPIVPGGKAAGKEKS